MIVSPIYITSVYFILLIFKSYLLTHLPSIQIVMIHKLLSTGSIQTTYTMHRIFILICLTISIGNDAQCNIKPFGQRVDW
ncbi:hypothetical protein BDB01DRAFT_809613 [Pilobolus umbonatus]|nr:hypothetical protein BDB01DRAFT_829515 [Pilobolus umbonatus]KAI8972691.1 hypothetical protein BDB01DRAFT_809613 [Pilobolus umbonatus]